MMMAVNTSAVHYEEAKEGLLAAVPPLDLERRNAQLSASLQYLRELANRGRVKDAMRIADDLLVEELGARASALDVHAFTRMAQLYKPGEEFGTDLFAMLAALAIYGATHVGAPAASATLVAARWMSHWAEIKGQPGAMAAAIMQNAVRIAGRHEWQADELAEIVTLSEKHLGPEPMEAAEVDSIDVWVDAYDVRPHTACMRRVPDVRTLCQPWG